MSSTLTPTAAEEMATTAMSDNFTIGTEQILVSLVLLLVSLFMLSRQPKSKMSIKRIIKRLKGSLSSSSLSLSRDGGWPSSNKNTPIRKSKSQGFVAWSHDHIKSPTVCTGFIFGSYGEEDSQTNSVSEETFFTDHERFANAYHNTIRDSEYRKLVLPPECKLLDPSKMKSRQTDITANATNAWMKIVDDFHKVISFDYIGYTIHFNIRIFKAMQYRWMKMWGKNVPEEEEEEDDDSTVASNGSRRSLHSKEGSVASSIVQSRSLTQSQGQSGSRQSLNGYVSAPSTPVYPSKYFNHVDSEDTITTTATNDTSTIPQAERLDNSTIGSASHGKQRDATNDTSTIPQAESLDNSSIGNLSHGKQRDATNDSTTLPQPECLAYTTIGSVSHVKQRDRFYTGDDHELNPKLFERLDRMPPRRPFYDESFDESTHSLEVLDEDVHGDVWIPLDDDQSYGNYGSNLSPIRGVPDEKKDSCNQFNALDFLAVPALTRKAAVLGKKKDNLEKWRTNANKSLIRPFPSSNGAVNATDEAFDQEKSHEMVYFDSAANNESIKRLEREAPMPDREGYILGDQFLEDPRDTPLLVFVNTRAGSQQGPILKTQLRSLLNPIQIWDLADGGPEKILKSFSVFSRLRVLVCGGDGTVSWIISTLDKMQLDRWPPIAILPLGTGNDLARMHGWGAGYANESLLMILDQVKESYISLLDRWTLTIQWKKKKKAKKKKTEIKPFINYMSIGMDAVSALQVHNLRENSPNMFFSRAVNKVWYALFGAEDAIKASCSDLPKQVVLEADGVEVPIPKDSQGLIFLNIDSYTGGVPLWSRGVPIQKKSSRNFRERRYSTGDFLQEGSDDSELFCDNRRGASFDDSDSVMSDGSIIGDENIEMTPEERLARIMDCTSPSSCQDGKLDVISHRGNFNLGQIRVGLSNAQRLCQCSKVKITMKKGIAVQVDGEPWQQESGVLTIERQKDPAMMLHRALEEGGGIETEVANLLEWAEDKKIIKKDAHTTLMKEFSRRVEKKTRARRNKTQQTVFASMKKRIASSNRFPSVPDM